MGIHISTLGFYFHIYGCLLSRRYRFASFTKFPVLLSGLSTVILYMYSERNWLIDFDECQTEATRARIIVFLTSCQLYTSIIIERRNRIMLRDGVPIIVIYRSKFCLMVYSCLTLQWFHATGLPLAFSISFTTIFIPFFFYSLILYFSIAYHISSYQITSMSPTTYAIPEEYSISSSLCEGCSNQNTLPSTLFLPQPRLATITFTSLSPSPFPQH